MSSAKQGLFCQGANMIPHIFSLPRKSYIVRSTQASLLSLQSFLASVCKWICLHHWNDCVSLHTLNQLMSFLWFGIDRSLHGVTILKKVVTWLIKLVKTEFNVIDGMDGTVNKCFPMFIWYISCLSIQLQFCFWHFFFGCGKVASFVLSLIYNRAEWYIIQTFNDLLSSYHLNLLAWLQKPVFKRFWDMINAFA